MIFYNMQSEHKKILVGIFVGIFLITIISGLTFKQNNAVDLKIVCINAGFCSSSAVCNVSIFAPNQNILLSGVQATQSANLAFHNVTLNSSLTGQIGEYSVGGFCKDGSVTQLIDFNFEITPTGFSNSSILILLVTVLLVSGIIIFFGFWIKDGWIVILGTFGLYFIGLFIMINGIVGIRDQVTTFALSLIILAIASYISVKSGVEMING